MHTTTPHGRELSVSKVSTTKSDPPTVANNMKRTTQSPSKAKQSQPTQSSMSTFSKQMDYASHNVFFLLFKQMPLWHLVYILLHGHINMVTSSDTTENSRSLGSVSFCNSTKSKTKSSLASKSSIPKPSIKQARRNVIKLCSPLQTNVSVRLCTRNL